MVDDRVSESPDEQRVSRLAASETFADSAESRTSEPRKLKSKPRSYSTMDITDEERLWAALSHASIWLTMLGGFLTAGFVIPITIFIPLVIFALYRKRSDYVAFHALQAFVLQLIGTVGALTLLVVGGAAWALGMILALLAVFILIGVILVPLWGAVGIALALLIFAIPLAALFLGTIAAIQTYNRLDYRYLYIAAWVDRQLAGGLLNTTL